MKNFICAFSFLCLLVLNSGNLFAESNKNKELLSLLDSYPEQSSDSVAIYNINTKSKIADIVIGDALVKVDQSYQSNISDCLLYTSPSPRDLSTSRMPSSA